MTQHLSVFARWQEQPGDELNYVPDVGTLERVDLCSYALQNPRAWDLCRPLLRENGGRAAFCYTPRGKNHVRRLYEEERVRGGDAASD
jgi:hypothetical protein